MKNTRHLPFVFYLLNHYKFSIILCSALLAVGCSSGENTLSNTSLPSLSESSLSPKLQTNYTQLGLSVYGLAETVAHQTQQIETNKSGVAIANALSGSFWLQANETTSLTLNAGYFEGSSALAVSGARRLHNHWSANFAVGTDTTRGEVGARAGLRLGW